MKVSNKRSHVTSALRMRVTPGGRQPRQHEQRHSPCSSLGRVEDAIVRPYKTIRVSDDVIASMRTSLQSRFADSGQAKKVLAPRRISSAAPSISSDWCS